MSGLRRRAAIALVATVMAVTSCTDNDSSGPASPTTGGAGEAAPTTETQAPAPEVSAALDDDDPAAGTMTGTFCTDVVVLKESLAFAEGAPPLDPAGMVELYVTAHAGYSSIEPPAEISAPWGDLTAMFGGFAAALEGVDTSSNEEIARALGSVDASVAQFAADAPADAEVIADYIQAECGFDIRDEFASRGSDPATLTVPDAASVVTGTA